jgi:hypothetical protein
MYNDVLMPFLQSVFVTVQYNNEDVIPEGVIGNPDFKAMDPR